MIKNYTTIYILFFFLTLFFTGNAQDLPPIVKYPPNVYAAGNQNWMISQDQNQFVFFANNDGLLEYNGSSWQLYPSPNETILRSVQVIGNKIYTGGYMEFGFWKRKTDGTLAYHSLSKFVKKQLLDDEQFWNILSFDQWVVFQSLDRMYVYDSKTTRFKIIASNTGIVKSFRTAHALYYQANSKGLFEIEGGKSKLISDDGLL